MKNHGRIYYIMGLVGLFLLIAVTVPPAAPAQDAPAVGVQQLRQWLGHPQVIIVDVRLPKHYQMTGTRIPGAYREQPALVEQWVEKYPRNKTIVFY